MIRAATEADIPSIEAILLDAVEWMDANGYHQWTREFVKWESLKRFFRPEDFVILFVGEEPAACLAIIDYDPDFWPDLKKGEALYLHRVAVKSAFRGRRFAGQLIDYAKELARARGIRSVRLDTRPDRQRVRAMYEREGFVFVGERVMYEHYPTAFYVCEIE